MLFDTCIKIEFEPMQKEHELLYNHSKSTLDKYKKKALRCEFSKEEELLFEMLIDIKLELQKLSQEQPKPLQNSGLIVKIDYDSFEIDSENLEIGKVYFAKIFFDEVMHLYFEATSKNYAKIHKIKTVDETRLASHIVNIQRILINDKRQEK